MQVRYIHAMSRVVALYRYPVKGFTPEACEVLTVLNEGRIAGDRVLSFRFADSGLPPTAWSRKQGHAVLVNTPELAKLALDFDHKVQRLRVSFEGNLLADAAIDDNGRKRIAAAVQEYILSLPENPLTDHPERMPLELIGDGVTPRYHDSESGQITLHGRASLTAVAKALEAPDLSELRFRSNIAIDGIAAWEEQDWIGATLRIGGIDFDVVRSKVRCLATHANPHTGERDLEVMQTLVRAFGQAQPTFAVAIVPRGRGGEIRVGDAVSVVR